MWVDPVTRYIHVTYQVPASAPEEVIVLCSWSPVGKGDWRPAKVTPLISETALRLLPEKGEWEDWVERGRIVERRAAGLERTVVFNPYPEAQPGGVVDVDFRIEMRTTEGQTLARQEARLQADNSDVLYIEDWTQVLQRDAVGENEPYGGTKWTWRTGMDPGEPVTFRSALFGFRTGDVALRPLTYPLHLRGPWAIFACCIPHYAMRLRLSGDERSDCLSSPRRFQEVFWKWARMDRQHLVLEQTHGHAGYSISHMDYVKLVPLSEELVGGLEAQLGGERDKRVVGYWEPYSWAFVDNVQGPLKHREPLAAFADARVDQVDIQLGRFGTQMVYETRQTDQLLYNTFGDPFADGTIPTTDNVGRMQQYTNTLETELRYARDFGLMAHANFGAADCAVRSHLAARVFVEHPEWIRDNAVRHEVPEVQEHILALYREALEIGAPGISLDYCRYPEAVDSAETCTALLRALRTLADEFGRARGCRVPILVRFPARGVRLWQYFDYETWIREGLVDYLCPSNIQGRHMHFDVTPYVVAARGTACKVLPVVDGLSWGLEMPGLFLWRVRQLYQAGVDGVYVYQADARVLGWPGDRRVMRMLGSSAAVQGWWERDADLRPRCSKGIYLSVPHYPPAYNRWERLRVWLEGVPMGEVELILDGRLVSRYGSPPYILGTEEYESDGIIPPGEHTLVVRARDGEGWLQQSWAIQGAD